MTKKGPLSKEERAYIEEHANSDTEEVAEHLGRSVAVVQRFLDALPPTLKAGELFARNEKYGSVSMTENASMVSDENRSKSAPDPPTRQRGSIHKIKGD